MSFKHAIAEHFIVVRWETPAAEDFERIVAEVAALRESTGTEVLYLSIMPEEMPNVDQATSKQLTRMVETLLPHCSMICVAMEMKGFVNAIIRSAMTALTLVTRRHDKLKFVDSVDKALEACQALHLSDRSKMAAALEEVGSPVPSGWAA